MRWILYLFPLLTFAQGPVDGFFKGEANADFAIGLGKNRSSTYTGHPDSTYNIPFSNTQLNIFAQYGISDHLDAVFNVPFVFGRQENKFQDIRLHLKYRALHIVKPHFKWSIIAAGGISFPTSDYRPNVSGAVGRREKKAPLQFITQLKLKNGLFFNVTGTYNLRWDAIDPALYPGLASADSELLEQTPQDSYEWLGRIGLARKKHFFELFLHYQQSTGGIDFKRAELQPTQLFAVNFLKLGGTYYFGEHANGIALNLSYMLPKVKRNIGNIFYAGVSFIIKHRKTNKN